MSKENSGKMSAGELGKLYEAELLVLFFQRAHSFKLDFQLGREVKTAGKFDDVVLKYLENGETWTFRYLQAKHCENEKNSITFGALFPSKNRAALQEKFRLDKYFISFNDIRRYHRKNQSELLKDLIIFTNVGFDEDGLKSSGIGLETVTDEFINYRTNSKSSKSSKLVKLNVDKTSDNFKGIQSLFGNSSDFNRLSQELVAQIKQSSEGDSGNGEKRIQISFNDDMGALWYSYSMFTESVDSSGHEFRFQEGFLQGTGKLSKETTAFRRRLIEAGKKEFNCSEEDFLSIAKKASVLVNEDTQGASTSKDVELKDLPWKFFEKLLRKIRNLESDKASRLTIVAQIQGDTGSKGKLAKLGVDESASKYYSRPLLDKVIKIVGNKFVFLEMFLSGQGISKTTSKFRQRFLEAGVKEFNCSEEEFLDKAKQTTVLVTENFNQGNKNGEEELPTTDTTVDDIVEFFQCLVFAVDQPNVHELKTFIANEELKQNFTFVDTDFIDKSLMGRLLVWINGQRSKEGWLKEEQVEEFYGSLAKMIISLRAEGVWLQYTNQFLELRGSASKTLKESLDDFLKNQHGDGCLLIKSEKTFLTCCKLYGLLKEKSCWGSFGVESAIFVNTDMMKEDKVKDIILEAFEKTNRSLLVLDCMDGSTMELHRQLIDVQKKCRKKLIFITSKELSGYQIIRKIIDKVNFEDLSDKSKSILLDKEIEFQGVPIKLRSAFNEEALKTILEPSSIVRLHKSDGRLEWGKPYQKPKHFLDDCYIKRLFWFEREIAVEIKDAANRSSELSQERSKIMVKENVAEEFLLHKDERFVIISDTAGMGKSTVLTSLAIRLKKQNPTKWVHVVELNNFTTVFDKYKERTRKDKRTRKRIIATRDEAVDLLSELCGIKEAEGHYLEKEVFFYYLAEAEHKMAIFFDGLDEICPDYKDTVLSFLEYLFAQTKIGKIVVTTRPNVEVALKSELGASSTYYLEPLNRWEQEEFLTEFWKKKIQESEKGNGNPNPETVNEHRIRYYAKNLIERLSSSINDKERIFTGVPLQIRMIAEIFEKRGGDEEEIFVEMKQKYSRREADDEESDSQAEIGISMYMKDYYYSGGNEPVITGRLELLYLYERFVEIKYWEILQQDKNHIDWTKPGVRDDIEERYGCFLCNYKTLGSSIVVPEEYKSIFSQSDKKIVKDFVSKIRNGKDRYGLVEGIVDEKPKFLHKTFAEYFFVEYLSDYLEESTRNEELDSFFFLTVLISDDYRTVRQFLETAMARRKTADEKYEHYQENVDAYLINPMDNNKTAVHVAMKEGNNCIIEFLDKCFGDRINHVLDPRFKNSDGETVICIAVSNGNLKGCEWLDRKGIAMTSEWGLLHRAAKIGSLEVVNFLLEKGVNAKQPAHDAKRKAIHYAAEEGHFEIVKRLIQVDPVINDLDAFGETVLFCAVSKRKFHAAQDPFQETNSALGRQRFKLVEFLIENGAKIHTGNNGGITPLIAASAIGDKEVVELLIKNGAKLRDEDKFGTTPLIAAIRNQNWETVQLLIDSKAKKGRRRSDSREYRYDSSDDSDDSSRAMSLMRFGKEKYRSPLIEAAIRGSVSYVRSLLEKGADLNKEETHRDITALIAASELGQTKVVELLLAKGADTSKTDWDGDTALIVASKNGRLQVVKCLLNHRADITVKNKKGTTALLAASRRGKRYVVELLLENGANIHDKDNDGTTPLIAASEFGDLATVRVLLDHGSTIDDRRSDGAASKKGNEDVVKLLLENGAHVYDGDKYGTTPLIAASEYGHRELVQFFLDNGSRIDEKRLDGTTPLIVACEKGHLEIVKLLLPPEANIHQRTTFGTTPLIAASRKGNLEIVKLLVERGADYRDLELDGTTPLIAAAASYSCLEVVKYLIQDQADVNEKRKDGTTALILACKKGYLDVVTVLIENGANIEERNLVGTSPLIAASKKGRLEVVRYLLEKGANVNDIGNASTALTVASKNKYLDIVELLLQNRGRISDE